MGELLRRRAMMVNASSGGTSPIYTLASPTTYANNAYEETGISVSISTPFTICIKCNLQSVKSWSAPEIVKAQLWLLRVSGNTGATAQFRHYLNGVYNWTSALYAVDARLVIVSTPDTVDVYYMDTNGAVSVVSRANADKGVSSSVQFGNINGGLWTTFDVYDYAFTPNDASAFLTE